MTPKSYTVLGWLVWQIAKRVARRKVTQNKAKLGAAATVGVVAVAGILAAKATSGSDD